MRKFVLLLFVVLVCPAVAADHVDSLPRPDANKPFSEVQLNSRTAVKFLESEAASALETAEGGRQQWAQRSDYARHQFSYDPEIRPGYGVVHWRIRNFSGRTVALKFFVDRSPDESRIHWTWPSADEHRTLRPEAVETFTTRNCLLGENVCYGAAFENDFFGPTYWGVGIKGKLSCHGCCRICGPQEDNYDTVAEHNLER